MQNQTTLPADTPSTAFATGTFKDDPMRNFGFTVSAYAILWAILLGFVFLGWRRQAALDARISELEGALAKKGPGASRES